MATNNKRTHIKRPSVNIKIMPNGLNVKWNARTKTLHIMPFAREMRKYVVTKGKRDPAWRAGLKEDAERA